MERPTQQRLFTVSLPGFSAFFGSLDVTRSVFLTKLSNAVRLYKRPTVEHDLAVSRVLQPPSPKRAKVSCDYSKQNKSPLQAGIENQAPVPMSDAMDLQSPAAKKGVSMTFNFHF